MNQQFVKPFGQLVHQYIDNDTFFVNISNNEKNKKLYEDWYISLDGVGGVNCVQFSNNYYKKLFEYKKCMYIGDFTCNELSEMSILYRTWFKYNKSLKSCEDVIKEVYEYVKCSREDEIMDNNQDDMIDEQDSSNNEHNDDMNDFAIDI